MAKLGSFEMNVRDLINRPGHMREDTLTVAAPADFRVALIGVPEGDPIHLSVRHESVHEGILETGSAQYSLAGECGRCLTPLTQTGEVEFQELFAYPSEEASDFYVTDDRVDLEQLVRDAIVIALPFQPVCSEDCPGLCPDCGIQLAQNPGHEHEPDIDPRWSALTQLMSEQRDNEKSV